jgi:uncharacterized membrane protein (GlpM family)
MLTLNSKHVQQILTPSDQKRAILPYVLFLVTVAMFVGRMELNEEVL